MAILPDRPGSLPGPPCPQSVAAKAVALYPVAEPGDDRHVARPDDPGVQRILSQYKRLVFLGKAWVAPARSRGGS
jgi:hypothetical protein